MIKIKIEIKKIGEFSQKVLIFLAQYLLLSCLILFCLTLIFGGYLFYRYSILVEKAEPETTDFFQLEEEMYQKILTIWEQREQEFHAASTKEYSDPFKKSVIIIEEGPEPGEEEEEELTK